MLIHNSLSLLYNSIKPFNNRASFCLISHAWMTISTLLDGRSTPLCFLDDVYTNFHGQIPSIGGVIPSAPSQVSYVLCCFVEVVWYGYMLSMSIISLLSFRLDSKLLFVYSLQYTPSLPILSYHNKQLLPPPLRHQGSSKYQ